MARILTIKTQIARLGVGIAGSFLALLAMFFLARWRVVEAMSADRSRSARQAVLDELLLAHGNMLLAAMDSIVDRNDGAISADRRETMVLAFDGFDQELPALESVELPAAVADKAARIGELLPLLREKVLSELDSLIRGAAQESIQLKAEFVAMDDLIDGLAQTLIVRLETLAKTEEGREPSAKFALEEAGKAVYRMNLVAMDVIVDQDEGISEERRQELATAGEALGLAIAMLRDHPALATQAKTLNAIVAEGEAITIASQRQLIDLVERYLVLAAGTERHFANLDDVIDETGEEIAQEISAIRAHFQQERQVSAEALVHRLDTTGWMVGVGTVLIGLAIFAGMGLFSRRLTQTLSGTMRDLSKSSESLITVAQQFADGSAQLAAGAAGQAAALEEISTTMDEMSHLAHANATASGSVESASRNALTVSGEGMNGLSGLAETINQVKAASGESMQIISAINEIAFQTKILSVNAAIEAARDSSGNSGFAVIAREIRALAQQSVLAAKRTSEILKYSLGKSDAGAEATKVARAAINGLVSAVRETADRAGGVASASMEQARGVQQAHTAIGNMQRSVQETSAHAEETAVVSRNLKSQANELQIQVRQLMALVGQAREP